MLGYRFVNLSPAQIDARRHHLDHNGFIAWLTPIVLLLGISIYRRVLGHFFSSSDTSLPPPPPPPPPTTPQKQHTPSRIRLYSRRTAWILQSASTPEFGPLHIPLLGTLYASWLIYLATRHTGDDYMHITKAVGHVAISQLPMHYLLSLKSPLSPAALATGLSHEQLNAYHRLLGRIVHAFLALHAVLYVRFFVALDLLATRIRHRDVRLGLLAFWTFNVLAVLALPVVRRRMYHALFYRSHVVLSAVLVPLLFFHVPYTRRYVVQAGVVWVVGGVLRARASVAAKVVVVEAVRGSDLLLVTLQVDRSDALANAVPGQHVYLRRDGLRGPRNPFSVVRCTASSASSSSSTDKSRLEIQLVVRNLQGLQTGYLHALARSSDRKPTHLRNFAVEGPYGESGTYVPRLLASSRNGDRSQILLVAGGVGATYTLPIYVALVEARGGTEGVKVLWLVRSSAEAQWGIEVLRTIGLDVDVEIYVTRRGSAGPSPSSSSSEQRLSSRADPSLAAEAIPGLIVHDTGSRPNIESLITKLTTKPHRDSHTSPSHNNINTSSHDTTTILSTSDRKTGTQGKSLDQKLTVLLCGPRGLSRAVRNVVGRDVLAHGRLVEWHEEQFGFGGS